MSLHTDSCSDANIATANLFTTAIAARKGIAEASDSKRRAASSLGEWTI